MAPDEAAFLDRVCAAPDDDGPRLIFADWLDERGNPRGEFIRIQCALDRLPADDPRRPDLTDREAMHLARFHAAWSEPVRGIAGWAEFRRGFIETVNIEARQFLLHAAALFRLAPIRHVRFLDVGSTLRRLTESAFLARLSAITIFAQHLNEDLTKALTESPHLGAVRHLNVGRNRVGDRGAERLAASPRFRTLTHLDLSHNAIGDTGVRAIAYSTNLAGLESLELRRNELSRAGLATLLASPVLTRMGYLGLGSNSVGAPLELTPQAGSSVSLKELDLSENGMTADSTRRLTESPGLAALARLDLQNNEVGNEGASALADWSGAAALRVLHLADNRIGDEGARALAHSTYLHNLTELDLSDNPIHDPGAFDFLNAPALPRLRRLGVPYLGLTPQMRRALVARYGG